MTDIAEMAKSLDYSRGLLPPNYPVPAIPRKVYYHFTNRGIAYIVVHDYDYMCWTFWKNGQFTVEKRG